MLLTCFMLMCSFTKQVLNVPKSFELSTEDQQSLAPDRAQGVEHTQERGSGDAQEQETKPHLILRSFAGTFIKPTGNGVRWERL